MFEMGALRKDFIGVVIVKVFGACMTILLSIYITRHIGKGAFGLISLANQILGLSVLIALSGYNQIAVREISKISDSIDEVESLTGFLRKFVWIRSWIIFFILALLSYPLFGYLFDSPHFICAFIIICFGFTSQSVSRIYSSVLLGLKKVWQANLTEQTLSSFLTLIGLFTYNSLGHDLELVHVAIAYMAARVIMYFAFNLYLKYQINLKLSSVLKESNKIKLIEGFNSKKSRRSFLVIALTGFAYNTINSFVLGIISSPVEVGVFNIILKISTPIAFVLFSFQKSSLPRLAKKYKQGDIQYIKTLFLKIGFYAGIIGLLFLILMVFFGKEILTIWQIEDYSSYVALIYVSIGFFINALTSVAGPILAMTDKEYIHSIINVTSLFVLIISSYALTYYFDIIGAAISFMSVMIFSNVWKVLVVYKRIFSFHK